MPWKVLLHPCSSLHILQPQLHTHLELPTSPQHEGPGEGLTQISSRSQSKLKNKSTGPGVQCQVSPSSLPSPVATSSASLIVHAIIPSVCIALIPPCSKRSEAAERNNHSPAQPIGANKNEKCKIRKHKRNMILLWIFSPKELTHTSPAPQWRSCHRSKLVQVPLAWAQVYT